MASGWPVTLLRSVPWAAAPADTGTTAYYIGLAVLVVIMIGVLIAAYRAWEEIHDVEDPDSPADLLESFEQAHAEGDLDEQELARVRRLLSDADGANGGPAVEGRPRPPAAAGEGRPNSEE
jgi:hypothetical protein